jgi:hypothetical protein
MQAQRASVVLGTGFGFAGLAIAANLGEHIGQGLLCITQVANTRSNQ